MDVLLFLPQDGSCGIPPLLVSRYAREMRESEEIVGEALDFVRLHQLQQLGRMGVRKNTVNVSVCLSVCLSVCVSEGGRGRRREREREREERERGERERREREERERREREEREGRERGERERRERGERGESAHSQ